MEHLDELIDGLMPVNISDCIFCHCSVLKKYGTRHNKSGSIQRFLCGNCKRTFSINIGFEKMKHNPPAVTTAMQLYFSGESLRNTQIPTCIILCPEMEPDEVQVRMLCLQHTPVIISQKQGIILLNYNSIRAANRLPYK
jgi:hypothetical protein